MFRNLILFRVEDPSYINRVKRRWSEHMQIIKEEIKLFLSSVDMMVYIRNPKECLPPPKKNLLELLTKFIRIAEFMINQKYQFVFLYVATKT